MDNEYNLYYKLIYTMPKKDGVGLIKIKVDFNERNMRYEEIDLKSGDLEKLISIAGYDYDLAVDVLLVADKYRTNWEYIEFF